MIRKMESEDIPACVGVIKAAFLTVAKEFHITKANAPAFTAFAINEDKLYRQYHSETRPMFVYCEDGKIVGYYSLQLMEYAECELNNLSILPAYRHKGIGAEMLKHAFAQARARNCHTMKIGIVEENRTLLLWYESFGFVHTGTQKFDFFPFTCGYLQKNLK